MTVNVAGHPLVVRDCLKSFRELPGQNPEREAQQSPPRSGERKAAAASVLSLREGKAPSEPNQPTSVSRNPVL